MSDKFSSKRTLLFVVFSLYCLLIGHKILLLAKNGDGVEYACVARNLAEGLGSFWSPYLSDTIHPVFHEHPPLVFWIQSLFFRLFGDGAYFEGVWGSMVGLIVLLCTAFFWQDIRRDFKLIQIGSWWPGLMLIAMPAFTYFFQTNRLVITWLIFAIIATQASYRSIVRGRSTVLWALLSGVLIYLGFIAKGPVAWFAFAVPAIGWLTLKAKFSKAVNSTLIATVTFILLFLATSSIWPASLQFWKGFWKAQIVASLTSTRGPGDSYWYLAERWASEIIVPVIVAGFIMLIAKASFRQLQFNRQAMFFLLIALVGSLPFTVSLRQHFRYILHSMPFFILSLSFLTQNIAIQLETTLTNHLKVRRALAVAGVFFLIVATATMLYRKDSVQKRFYFYQDLYLQNIEIPERIIISVCPEEMIKGDWLFTDMQRFYKVSLDAKPGYDYLIIDKNSACEVPKDYHKVHQQTTRKYLLYKRIQP